VEAGVAAGADGDQPGAVVDARLTMMHMEAVGGTAEAGEVLPGVGGGTVTGAAEAGDGGEVLAGAEQGSLF
jgi:hypothetical protein